MAECKVECLHRKQCDAMNNPCWHHTKVISELQQAQAELNDAQAWLYDAEMRNQHIYSCMDNLEEKYRQAQASIAAMQKKHSEQETLVAIIKKAGNDAIDSGLDSLAKLEQQQATIATMRLALEKIQKETFLSSCTEWKDGWNSGIIRAQLLVEQALQDTAGAELLEKIDKLERENKAMRNCANCNNNRVKCMKCDDLNKWQIAERLVSKGE